MLSIPCLFTRFLKRLCCIDCHNKLPSPVSTGPHGVSLPNIERKFSFEGADVDVASNMNYIKKLEMEIIDVKKQLHEAMLAISHYKV